MVIKKVFMDGSARFLSFDQIEMAMLTSDGKIGNNSSQFYLYIEVVFKIWPMNFTDI